jgi:hypothetical protein
MKTALHYDSGKCRLDLLPGDVLWWRHASAGRAKYSSIGSIAGIVGEWWDRAPVTLTGMASEYSRQLDDLHPLGGYGLIADVLEYGAIKYAAGGTHNWRRGMRWSQVYGSFRRHHEANQLQEHAIDEESGLLHVAHAACCLMFLAMYWRYDIGTDDRPPSWAEFRDGKA